MADRRVTHTEKDSEGDITALCNPYSWGQRAKADAIRDIENGIHTYYVDAAGSRSDVHVVSEGGDKYLRTDADTTSRNNLDNLPDC